MRLLFLGFCWVIPILTVSAQTNPPGALRVSPSALQFMGVSGVGSTPAQSLSVINETAFPTTINGSWSGSFSSDGSSSSSSSSSGISGSVQATFNQSGNTFTGNFTIMSDLGSATGSVTGTIVGTTVRGTGTSPAGAFEFQGIFAVNTITGAFVLTDTDSFEGSSTTTTYHGPFSLTRVGGTPPPGSTITWTQQAGVLTGPSGWLMSQPATGNSVSGAALFPSIDVSAAMNLLAPGQYSGQIIVSSSGATNSPISVPVLINVLPSGTTVAPQVRPGGLLFVANTASPRSQPIRISTASAGTIQVDIVTSTADNRPWLVLNQTRANLQNSTPLDLNVGISASGLSAGVYQGQIRLTFGDGSPPQTVPVVLVVPYGGFSQSAQSASGTVAAGCNPTTLVAVDRLLGSSFTSLAAWPANLEALVVDDCGFPANNATVSATFSNGDSPLALVPIGNGLFSASWRPINPAANVTVTLTATFPPLKQAQVVVGGRVADNPSAPAIFSGGIVGGANFSGATLAPGGIVSIFGKNLAQTGAAERLPLPTELGGLKISAAGRDLPLFFVSGGQVNAQLPSELTSGTKVAVVATVKAGGTGNPVIAVPEVITVGAAAPGIFSTSQDGKGQGVILDPVNRLVDGRQTTATSGDVVVIYCTGLGATTPAVASGVAAPGGPVAQVTPAPQVSIGGRAATVQFAGLTPGLVALYQINVVVPTGVTAGAAVPVTVTVAGVTSNIVTMAVR